MLARDDGCSEHPTQFFDVDSQAGDDRGSGIVAADAKHDDADDHEHGWAAGG
ncbi:hypothetical protein PGTUg99_027480 [Puccinia graminis f. sp. tritici]|uniref:Uncharacterized protein n=1 Tax=Puccinia graminis f. sp. tritici TaxID=56615 RepID=A0A5B0N1B6_PUCGR|nr:hypothetical protein PGTUg99_027480 [Puccinia graminis f. sp. tritici]